MTAMHFQISNFKVVVCAKLKMIYSLSCYLLSHGTQNGFFFYIYLCRAKTEYIFGWTIPLRQADVQEAELTAHVWCKCLRVMWMLLICLATMQELRHTKPSIAHMRGMDGLRDVLFSLGRNSLSCAWGERETEWERIWMCGLPRGLCFSAS